MCQCATKENLPTSGACRCSWQSGPTRKKRKHLRIFSTERRVSSLLNLNFNVNSLQFPNKHDTRVIVKVRLAEFVLWFLFDLRALWDLEGQLKYFVQIISLSADFVCYNDRLRCDGPGKLHLPMFQGTQIEVVLKNLVQRGYVSLGVLFYVLVDLQEGSSRQQLQIEFLFGFWLSIDLEVQSNLFADAIAVDFFHLLHLCIQSLSTRLHVFCIQILPVVASQWFWTNLPITIQRDNSV